MYVELCDVLGITLNEFFAGENIEPTDVLIQAEKNLLGVAAEGSKRSGKLKKIVLLATGIALVLAVVLCCLLNKEGYFLDNYIKVLDETTQESKIANTITTENPLLFSFEIDEKYTNAYLVMREYKDGVDISSGGGPDISFTNDGKRTGTIAIVPDVLDGNGASFILSSGSGKVSMGLVIDETLNVPEKTGSYMSSLAGQSFSLIKVRAAEEIPLGALYLSTREEDYFPGIAYTIEDTVKAISTAAPEYCYLFSIKFGTDGVVVPDLTNMLLDDAMKAIKGNGLTLGKITYFDTVDEAKAVVYHQIPPPGINVPMGTMVDVDLKNE